MVMGAVQRFSSLRKQTDFLFCLLSTTMLSLNMLFLHSLWIGVTFFVVYAIFVSRAISRRLAFFEKDLVLPFGFLFLTMFFMIFTAITIRLSVPLSNELLILFLLVPMFFFLKQKDGKNNIQTPSEDVAVKKHSVNPILLVAFCLSLLGMLLALFYSRTGSTIAYFQEVLNPSYYLFNFVAIMLVVVAILSRYSLRSKLVFVLAYSVVAHLFRYIIYAVMTGSDMWDNLIKAWWIYDGGTILPHSTLYTLIASGDNAYLGLWGINVSTSHITGIDLYSLYPYIGLLLAFFVPLVLYQIVKSLLNNDTYALLVSLMCSFLWDTFIWLSLSSANGLGFLAMLFSLLFWITYLKKEKMSMFLPLLITMSGILAYPLTGIYTVIIALLSIYIKRSGLRKKVIILGFLSCAVIPLYDVTNRLFSFLFTGVFPVPNFISVDALFSSLIFPSQRTGLSNLLDIPYLIVYLLVGIGIIVGRRQVKREIYWMLLILLIAVLFGEAYGWLIQERTLHRIGYTILPWLYLIFSGMSFKFVYTRIVRIIPTFNFKVNLKQVFRRYKIESKKFFAISLCLTFGIFSTANFVFSPTTNSYNPSTDLVNAVNYVISQDPNKESLIVADGYSLTLLAAFSHDEWYHSPHGTALKVLLLAAPLSRTVLSSPSELWTVVQEVKNITVNALAGLNVTFEINKFYLIYDAVLIKTAYGAGAISPSIVPTLSSVLGEPTVFGQVYVYSSKMPVYLNNVTIPDISGNHNDGTIYGLPLLEDGPTGKCATFDGLKDQIVAPALNLTQTFTIESWVRFVDGQPSGSYGGLFDLCADTDYLRFLISNDTILLQMLTDKGVITHKVSNLNLTNTWRHYVATFDGANVSMYLDNQLVYTGPQSDGILEGANRTYIGTGSVLKTWYHLKGSLDEIRIYDRAVNQSEVAYSYANQYPMNPQGLQLWYSYSQNTILTPSHSPTPSPTVSPTPSPTPSITTISDLSGNNNAGVANGVALEEGYRGKCVTFDGIDDKIVAPALNLSTGFTIESWVRFVDGQPSGTYGGIFDLVSDKDHLRILLLNNSILLQMTPANGSIINLKSPAVNMSNNWHHVACTYNKTVYCLYLDGQLIYHQAQTANLLSGANVTYIGAGSVLSTWYHLKGSLDDFFVYNRALNDTEVAYSYQYGTPMNNQGLLLWYSFDE